jgi:hypothetical protein
VRQSRPHDSPGAERIDFLVGGKPPGLLLRERQATVDSDLENATDSGHQLDFGTILLNQFCPRTEGARFIVSRLAPLDGDLHLDPPLRSWFNKTFTDKLTMIPRGVSGLVFCYPEDWGNHRRKRFCIDRWPRIVVAFGFRSCLNTASLKRGTIIATGARHAALAPANPIDHGRHEFAFLLPAQLLY